MFDEALRRLRWKIDVKHPSAEILTTCRVLWDGWECDTRLAVVRIDGSIRALSTDRGTLVWVEAGFLRDRLEQYQQCITETTHALNVLQGKSG